MRRGLAAAGVAAAMVLAAPGTASAAPPVECTGTFIGFAPGNLIVPEGALCEIVGGAVGNNVKVQPGALGFHAEGAVIGGNVQSPGPVVGDVRIVTSEIGGNVTIQRSGTGVELTDNLIGGSVSVDDNTGPVTILRNTIDGALSCQGNVPPPVSALNTARSFSGQCQA